MTGIVIGEIAVSIILVCMLASLLIRFWRIDEMQEHLMKVPQVKLANCDIVHFDNDSVSLNVAGSMRMGYSHLRGEVPRPKIRLIKNVARFVRTVSVDVSSVSLSSLLGHEIDSEAGDENRNLTELAVIKVPKLQVDIRPGAETAFNITCEVSQFADPDVLARLGDMLVRDIPIVIEGAASVSVRRWFFWRTADILKSLAVPSVANNLNVEVKNMDLVEREDQDGVVQVKGDLLTEYLFPMSVNVPAMDWDLALPGCFEDSEPVLVSQGKTDAVTFHPESNVTVTVVADLERSVLDGPLTEPCSGPAMMAHTRRKMQKSDIKEVNDGDTPLTRFISRYLAGMANSVRVQGSSRGNADLPMWMKHILAQVSLPFDFPGKRDDEELIKHLEFRRFRLNFNFADMEGLSSDRFDADTQGLIEDLAANVSTEVKVEVQLPHLFNISESLDIDAYNVRGNVNLFSQGQFFAYVDIDKWINSTTTRSASDRYTVSFELEGVPLVITNQNAFGRVAREIMVKGKSNVHVESLVDAKVACPLGSIGLTGLPASGDADIERNGSN